MSRQLGHAYVGVSAKHYARWTGGNTYRSALNVDAGEVPADLLARFFEEKFWSDQSRMTRDQQPIRRGQ